MVQQPIFYRGKVITTMHDLTTIRFRNHAKNPLVFTVKQQIYKWINKRAARKSAAVIVPTEFVKNDVASYTHVNPDKITFTHEAADDFDEPAKEMPFFKNKPFIMGDGRPRAHKNVRNFVDAFATLYKKQPDLYLMLTGKRDKAYEALEAYIQSLGIQDRVVHTDFIPDGELKWAMQHTKAYVWPSLSEGFGLPPLEAMLNGAPVVSSNASCMPEVLGDAAHYFDPTSPEDMARAIEEVITDPILREDLVEKGKAQAAKYSWRRMAEQTLEVYEKVFAS
jgi:glycosyltransferase involved in cell wall biosynthesis